MANFVLEWTRLILVDGMVGGMRLILVDGIPAIVRSIDATAPTISTILIALIEAITQPLTMVLYGFVEIVWSCWTNWDESKSNIVAM